MSRTNLPIPRDPKSCPPWLYEYLKRLNQTANKASTGIAQVVRGETPDGSGQPLVDTSNFFFKPGLATGQIGFGGVNPADNLYLSSTKSATKGFIHLGYPTPILSVDESQDFVGINKSAPASTLHIVGSLTGAGSGIVPSSNINTSWESRGGGTWAIIGTALWSCASADDGDTTMAVHHAGASDNPQKFGLGGTIVPGAVYTVTFRCATFGSTPVYGAGNTNALWCSLVDSAGNEWMCTEGVNAPFTEILSPGPTFYTITRHVVCSGSPFSTGNTPNALWANMTAQVSHGGGGDLYMGCTLASVSQAGSSLMRWDTAAGTQSGQIALDGKFGINTGSTAPGATLDVLQGASAGVPAFRIKAEAAPTAGVYQFVITNNSGIPIVFFDSGLGDIFQASNFYASVTLQLQAATSSDVAQITTNVSGVQSFNIPNVGGGGDFVITIGAQSLNFKTLNVGCNLVASTASSGVAFQDTTTATKKLRMVLSGAVGNNNFVIATTAARTYTFRDVSGGVVLDSGSALTSGRVPFATTGGALQDSSLFLFSTGSGLTLSALNLITDTTTGMKIATATNQKISFWNAAPIVQPTTAIAAATFVANTSAIANDTATWDGYTVGQVVKALRNMGLLA